MLQINIFCPSQSTEEIEGYQSYSINRAHSKDVRGEPLGEEIISVTNTNFLLHILMSNSHNPLQIPFHKIKATQNFAPSQIRSWKKKRLESEQKWES